MCNYSEYKKIISEEIGEKIPTGKEIDRVGEISRRYFVDGGAGEELTIHDIFALGDFLPGGAFFGMVAPV